MLERYRHIKNLIAEGKVGKALESIGKLNPESNNQSLFLSSQLSRIKELFQQGYITLDEYITRTNRIILSTISYLQELAYKKKYMNLKKIP